MKVRSCWSWASQAEKMCAIFCNLKQVLLSQSVQPVCTHLQCSLCSQGTLHEGINVALLS